MCDKNKMLLEDLQSLCSEKLKEKAFGINLDDPAAIFSFMEDHEEEMVNDYIEEAIKKPIRPLRDL